MQEQHQSLFERISDSYANGPVECKHICEDYMDLRFMRTVEDSPGELEDVEIGHVRMAIVYDVTIGSQILSSGLVRVTDHYTSEEVLVSPVVTALIAVSTR